MDATADVRSPRATIDDMAWFAGKWTGTGLGGATEETWSAPAGSALMGMFRLVKDGKVGGLTFKRVGDNTLEVFLAIRNRDGSVREEAFKMTRATS